jgi:hypothetical protein
VFHVTNSGYSSFRSRLLLEAKEKSEDRDGSELVELAGVSAPDAGVFWLRKEDVVDRVECRLLEELPALVSRLSNLEMAAGLAVVVFSSASASVISASSSSSSSCSSSSSAFAGAARLGSLLA